MCHSCHMGWCTVGFETIGFRERCLVTVFFSSSVGSVMHVNTLLLGSLLLDPSLKIRQGLQCGEVFLFHAS